MVNKGFSFILVIDNSPFTIHEYNTNHIVLFKYITAKSALFLLKSSLKHKIPTNCLRKAVTFF